MHTMRSSDLFCSFTEPSIVSAMSFIVPADPRRLLSAFWFSVSTVSASATDVGSLPVDARLPNSRLRFVRFCILQVVVA